MLSALRQEAANEGTATSLKVESFATEAVRVSESSLPMKVFGAPKKSSLASRRVVVEEEQ